MSEFRISGIYESESALHRFDSTVIRSAILSDSQLAAASNRDVGVVFVCRKDISRYKNDSWIKKGWAYHTIILPYEAVMAMSDAEANQLAIQYIAERYQQLIKKKHKTVLPLQAAV